MYEQPVDKKPVMKTKHLHKIPEKKQVWPCIGSIKYDGVYAYQIIVPGDYRIFSATGMQYHSLKHIEKSAKENLFNMEHCVLIFEVYHADYPINIISGYCREEKAQHPELYAVVHDCIPYRDFVEQACQIPYFMRKGNINRIFDEAKVEHYNLPMEFTLVNLDDAEEVFNTLTANGHEGIIGRNPNGMWLGGHRRNEDLWKMKIELSYDLEVTHVFEGAGKYKDTLGTLGCRFRLDGESDGLLDTVICSGMTDAQRHAWWADPSSIIGKIVKVDAMTFTKNGLLREPRFKEVREDKNEADF